MAKFIVLQFRDAEVEAGEKADEIKDWHLRSIEDQDEGVFTVHDFHTSQEIIDANGAEIEHEPRPN